MAVLISRHLAGKRERRIRSDIERIQATLADKGEQGNVPSPGTEPSAQLAPWQVDGARTKVFELYRAACLLAGDKPTWPLATQRSRDGYAALCSAITAKELDEPEAERQEDNPSYQFGWFSGDDTDGVPSTVHEMGLDRRVLRRYLYRHNRPIPEFLSERFDERAAG